MIFIIKNIVRNYIPKLTTQDLEMFAEKHNLKYSQDELIIVYNFIKYNYNELLNENIKVFEDLREKINPVLYKDLLKLYIDYKQKYL